MTLTRTTILAGISAELTAFGALLGELPDEELELSTRCEGWTVRDVAGHVIGTVVDITQGRLEGLGRPEVNSRQARDRAGTSREQLTGELDEAQPVLEAVLDGLVEEDWDEPVGFGLPGTLGFAVEAIWYDTYLHADDIRQATARPPERGEGLRCAVHHVAGYLEQKGWTPTTLRLEGMESIEIAGGGASITGDPLTFVLAATGRADPPAGFDESINVYADG
jgi:uncharacterized protein (TIGR03083 family)